MKNIAVIFLLLLTARVPVFSQFYAGLHFNQSLTWNYPKNIESLGTTYQVERVSLMGLNIQHIFKERWIIGSGLDLHRVHTNLPNIQIFSLPVELGYAPWKTDKTALFTNVRYRRLLENQQSLRINYDFEPSGNAVELALMLRYQLIRPVHLVLQSSYNPIDSNMMAGFGIYIQD